MNITKEMVACDLQMSDGQIRNAIELSFFESMSSPAHGKNHRHHAMTSNLADKKWSTGFIILSFQCAKASYLRLDEVLTSFSSSRTFSVDEVEVSEKISYHS